MITAKKVFGSYVLQDVGLIDIAPGSQQSREDSPDAEFLTSCAIPAHWTSLKLLEIKKYNHDTSLLRFSLPLDKRRLDLPVGSFLLIRAPGCEKDGKDAIRPYTSVSDDYLVHDLDSQSSGSFQILCKRYDEWGTRESKEANFLFTKSDHSYRPPGAASNYIHKLVIGSSLDFQFTKKCIGRNCFPFLESENEGGTKLITMIAVGVGIAPMIHTLRAIFKRHDRLANQLKSHAIENVDSPSAASMATNPQSLNIKVKLLYGVREVSDILLREELELWRVRYADIFSVLYCVGSRWTNIHIGARTRNNYIPPPLPRGFSEIADRAELGWVNEDKIKKHGYPPGDDSLVVVCGLPGVYDKLCGPRCDRSVAVGSALHSLGYTEDMVVKL